MLYQNPDNRSLLRLLLTSDHNSPTVLLAQISLALLAFLNLFSMLFGWFVIPILFLTVFLFLLFVLLNLAYVFLLDALGCVQDTLSDQWEQVGIPLTTIREQLGDFDTDIDDIYHFVAETYELVHEREERQKFVPKTKRKQAPKTMVLESIHTTQELIEA